MTDACGSALHRYLVIAGAAVLFGTASWAQNSWYHLDESWGQPPREMNGGKWRQVTGVSVDDQGTVYVLHKCFSETCTNRPEPPVVKLDRSGKFLKGWGEHLIPSPHGLYVDRQGFVWATDAPVGNAPVEPGKGHQVFKFSPDGQLLLTLGTAGVNGTDDKTFNGPAAVAVAANGDIFVADGHGNNRVVKFSKDGKYLKAWGKEGSGPGEFKLPHSIAIDSRGRLFVGDRGNNRIEIFDQDGTFLEEWRQFGRPDGMFITRDDLLYVSDSQATPDRSRGGRRGVSVGSAKTGVVTRFLEDPAPDPGSGAEFVAADGDGNIYWAAVRGEFLRKYVRY